MYATIHHNYDLHNSYDIQNKVSIATFGISELV